MSELIDTIIKTRETTADIFARSLVDIEGLSEVEILNKITTEVKNNSDIYPIGWYCPPPSGGTVLLAEIPFERLKYDSIRKPEYFPKENLRLKKETTGMIHFSPVDCKTNMIGDIGFTLYRGDSKEIKEHIKKSYNAILEVAKHAEVGMSFRDLSLFAIDLFKNEFKITKIVNVSSDPNVDIDMGHSIPGSFEDQMTFGNTFPEIIESIRTKRVHINETENFKIPKTCAFTIESRLGDINNLDLPSTYFHFIVCFDNGEKAILENFKEIFETVGMDYMNLE